MGGLLMPQEIKPCDNSTSIVLEDISGTNPDEVAVWGESAGGYLTAMTGTTNGEEEFEEGENLDQSSDVRCAGSYCWCKSWRRSFFRSESD